ncbi:hypothetical protein DAPPUDRAFT_331248 [Daphnia pulex]|uniref:Uncharacterized protein n=1 Tax=Daphnia pulex TaxID=6669 RepID=E9HLX2_DAPPU|nr:hypothetical protein DAPPUDRAFT_331248 [Daphnia pulex]|eukprot:EFX67263.1 hypothetical protein DAPPUDRAFT_331248 [Daphnia pulex]
MVLNEESNGAQLSSIKVVDSQPCSAVATCSHSTSFFEAFSDVLDNVAKRIRKAPDRLGEWQYADDKRNNQASLPLSKVVGLNFSNLRKSERSIGSINKVRIKDIDSALIENFQSDRTAIAIDLKAM